MDNKYDGLLKHSKEVNQLVIESIEEAVLILMKDKEYNKITITEICKKAGVSRMGFYGNFKTVEDVLKKITIDLHEKLFSSIGSPFRDYLKDNWYLDMFKMIEENMDTLDIVLNSTFQVQYIEIVNDIILKKSKSINDRCKLLIWAGGLINIITYWLKNRDITAEELAILYNENLDNLIKNIYTN